MNEQNLSEPLFEHPVAEQVLAVAARLQQEHRDKISLSQLTATAAEVGIEPEFVAEAVRRINVLPIQKIPQPRSTEWNLESSAVAIACLFLVLALHLFSGSRPDTWINHGLIPIFGVAVAAGLLPRQITTRIGLASILAISFVLYFPILENQRSHGWLVGPFPFRYLTIVFMELVVFGILRSLYFYAGRSMLNSKRAVDGVRS